MPITNRLITKVVGDNGLNGSFIGIDHITKVLRDKSVLKSAGLIKKISCLGICISSSPFNSRFNMSFIIGHLSIEGDSVGESITKAKTMNFYIRSSIYFVFTYN